MNGRTRCATCLSAEIPRFNLHNTLQIVAMAAFPLQPQILGRLRMGEAAYYPYTPSTTAAIRFSSACPICIVSSGR